MSVQVSGFAAQLRPATEALIEHLRRLKHYFALKVGNLNAERHTQGTRNRPQKI